MVAVKSIGDHHSDHHEDKECVQGSPNKALKSKLPSLPQCSVGKKGTHSAGDASSFVGREHFCLGEGESGTNKRTSSPPPARKSWSQPPNNKIKLSDDIDAHDDRTSSLPGREADPGSQGTRLHAHRTHAKERLRSSGSGCNDALHNNKKLRMTSVTSREVDRTVFRNVKQTAIVELRAVDVRVFEKMEVMGMTGAWSQVMGAVVFGSCIKTGLRIYAPKLACRYTCMQVLVRKSFLYHASTRPRELQEYLASVRERDGLLEVVVCGDSRKMTKYLPSCHAHSYLTLHALHVQVVQVLGLQ